MAFDLSPSHRVTPDCQACPVKSCLARCEVTANTWQAMVNLMPAQKPGSHALMTAGQPTQGLFSVRAGCIKSYTLDTQGNEHVRAFHFPGDLVGLDSLGSSRAAANATAVTPSQVCAVPAAELRRQLATHPNLATSLLEKTRRELGQALSLLGEFSADQRVAAFLMQVHARIGSGNVLRLPMTRREIGSYLRLATETVCRVLARFEEKGWLVAADKRITLLNTAALHDLGEPVGLGLAA